MPRRSPISLADVAAFDNLAAAFWRASRGSCARSEVRRFADALGVELAALRRELLDGSVALGDFRCFRIFDPKPRTIHAPAFRERVIHHALMGCVGPVLDRALVSDTFACRPGKGSLAAVKRAQQHLRRFPWYVQVDVHRYFASVDHAVLRAQLRRRLKDPGVLALCDRILGAYQDPPTQGRGLPIGALASQHFANFYLADFDRDLLEREGVRGMVRYMDDVVWWCDSRDGAQQSLARAERLLEDRFALRLGHSRVQRSAHGLGFLGFRIYPGCLRLSRRRRSRYRAARRLWEKAYAWGRIDARALQAGYAAAFAIAAHAESTHWRRRELARNPALDA